MGLDQLFLIDFMQWEYDRILTLIGAIGITSCVLSFVKSNMSCSERSLIVVKSESETRMATLLIKENIRACITFSDSKLNTCVSQVLANRRMYTAHIQKVFLLQVHIS